VILLDTHVWVWWAHDEAQLPGAFHRDPAAAQTKHNSEFRI